MSSRSKFGLITLIVLFIALFLIMGSLVKKAASYAEESYPAPMNQSPYPSTSEKLAYPIPQTSEGDSLQLSKDERISEAAKTALEYIADRYQIPKDNLKINYDKTIELKESGKEYQAVTIIAKEEKVKIFKLVVDLSDLNVIEDVRSIIKAEREAYESKYGKLELDLYNLLQNTDFDEIVAVSIWVPYYDGKSNSYVELIGELEALGYEVNTIPGVPTLTVSIPKELIMELSERENIDRIYLANKEVRTKESNPN